MLLYCDGDRHRSLAPHSQRRTEEATERAMWILRSDRNPYALVLLSCVYAVFKAY